MGALNRHDAIEAPVSSDSIILAAATLCITIPTNLEWQEDGRNVSPGCFGAFTSLVAYAMGRAVREGFIEWFIGKAALGSRRPIPGQLRPQIPGIFRARSRPDLPPVR